MPMGLYRLFVSVGTMQGMYDGLEAILGGYLSEKSEEHRKIY